MNDLLCAIFEIGIPGPDEEEQRLIRKELIEEPEASKNPSSEVTSIQLTNEDVKEQMLLSELLEEEENKANFKDLPHWIVEA